MHHKRNEVYQLFADRPHGGDGEIRTLAPVLSRPTAFRVRTLQPLGYISESETECSDHVPLYSQIAERSILFLPGKESFVDAKTIL